jgi:hypothetical protein
MRKMTFLFLLYLRPVVRPLLYLAAVLCGVSGLFLCFLLYLDDRILFYVVSFWAIAAVTYVLWWEYDQLLLRLSPERYRIVLW